MKQRIFTLLLVLPVAVLFSAGGTFTHAQGFADPAFQSTWERTDKAVADGAVKRSFYWGPAPRDAQQEAYAEGAEGKRLVQYFDKSRMEINNPSGNKNDPFYVTNGLLTVELITGRMQVGNNTYTDRYPAEIPLASDSDDATAPTYATFSRLMEKADNKVGSAKPSFIDRASNVTTPINIAATTQQQIVYYEPTTGHNVPRVFWDFLNASGPVYIGGKSVTGRLNDPWFYAAGYPISEPYWANVKIGGQLNTAVYIQAFQRRVLTFVPSLPAGFQVQMGNIGLHYYDWRYNNAGRPGSASGTVTGSTPAPSQPVGTGGDAKLQLSGVVNSPTSLDMAALKALPAQSVTANFTEGNHTYKGPLLLDLLHGVGGQGTGGRDLLVRYLVATGQGGQKVVLSWGEIDPIFAGTKVLVAYSQDGADMPSLRLVIPSDKSGARSLQGLTQVEVATVAPAKPTGTLLKITGLVGPPLLLQASDLSTRNPTSLQATYMAGGTIATHSYKGVSLLQLLNEAGVRSGSPSQSNLLSRYVVAAGSDGRQAILSWGELDLALSGVPVMVAYEESGVPLGGGLTRLVVPSDARGGRYVPYLLSLDVRSASGK
ncbi:MAG: molybdopterin-dependent oxidoreductase [Chloroflexota bacterium]|nr:molybdopterin-dependent oxidoreductase [Chloroflexota bacterium]